MGTIQIQSRVGEDGVLMLRVPVGRQEAGQNVIVTIQALPSNEKHRSVGAKEWHRFVQETYGSCADLGLERQPEGGFEQREQLA